MKAKTYGSRKAKGRRLEVKFAQMLRDYGLDPHASRMVGSGAWFGFETDIKTSLPYAFEAKNQERVTIWEWWEQAERGRKPFKDPVLVFSGNYRPILITLKAEDFLNLLKKVKDYEDTGV